MARAFFSCVICGKAGEADVGPDDPATKPALGWVAFLAVHWPPGITPGPLVLRNCGGCYLAGLVRSH